MKAAGRLRTYQAKPRKPTEKVLVSLRNQLRRYQARQLNNAGQRVEEANLINADANLINADMDLIIIDIDDDGPSDESKEEEEAPRESDRDKASMCFKSLIRADSRVLRVEVAMT